MTTQLTATLHDVLDAAIGAARELLPDADEDKQADLAERIIRQMPTRVTITDWQEWKAAHADALVRRSP